MSEPFNGEFMLRPFLILLATTGVFAGVAASAPLLSHTPPASHPPLPTQAPLDSCTAQINRSPTYSRKDIDERLAASKAAQASEPADLNRTMPVALRSFGPSYPECAWQMKVALSSCTVVHDLSASGKPENIMPVCEHAIFESAATAAAQLWTYEPATLDGEPVATPNLMRQIDFMFDLSPSPGTSE